MTPHLLSKSHWNLKQLGAPPLEAPQCSSTYFLQRFILIGIYLYNVETVVFIMGWLSPLLLGLCSLLVRQILIELFFLLLYSWWTGCFACWLGFPYYRIIVFRVHMDVFLMEWLSLLLIWLSSWWYGCYPCWYGCPHGGMVVFPVHMVVFVMELWFWEGNNLIGLKKDLTQLHWVLH